jgi:pyrimidine-nucleoside phosphorylase
MGKKLAADDDCIVLDVKTGSGAFAKTVEESVRLARIMVDIGKSAGKKMLALITDMDRPLGANIGNSLEVIEAINTLKGNGPDDFTEVCIILATNMLYLAGKGTMDQCEAMVKQSIADGSALDTLAKMVEAQHGNPAVIYNPDLFEKAKFSREVKAERGGYITRVDTEGYGIASLMLGAGRNTKEESIDYSAGITLLKKTGDKVDKDEVIAVMYTNDQGRFEGAVNRFNQATTIDDYKPEERPLVFERVE